MGVPSKGIVVIRIERGDMGRWNVLESDFEDPLAAFDDRQSACDYANKLSACRTEATVILLDEAASPGADSLNQSRSRLSH
ncbi:MAG: hypothetical protein ACO1NO_06080 [Burkholderiaceae bacterium]